MENTVYAVMYKSDYVRLHTTERGAYEYIKWLIRNNEGSVKENQLSVLPIGVYK